MAATARACQADALRDDELPGSETTAARGALDRPGPARGAHEWLMRPVRCDERQRFRRPILLDPPSAHGDSPPVRNLYYPDLDALPPGAISPATGAFHGHPAHPTPQCHHSTPRVRAHHDRRHRRGDAFSHGLSVGEQELPCTPNGPVPAALRQVSQRSHAPVFEPGRNS